MSLRASKNPLWMDMGIPVVSGSLSTEQNFGNTTRQRSAYLGLSLGISDSIGRPLGEGDDEGGGIGPGLGST